MCAGPPGQLPARRRSFISFASCSARARMGLDRRRGRGVTWRTLGRTKGHRESRHSKFSGISGHNHYYRRYVTRSNEYFPKFGSKAGLDRMDVTILGLLQNNARLSGLAPSSTRERIKRMRDAGVLRGTHVEVSEGIR